MYDFDFGTMLARGQDLKHEFRWVNRTDKPIRVVGSKVNVPCCSRLGELPKSIPAGGSAIVPVFLKAGRVADAKRVTFDVETDAPAESVAVFTVVARFVPEWEIQEAPVRPTSLPIGQAGSRSYRLIGRRKAGEGRPAPAEVIAAEPLRVESITAAAEVEGSDGIIASSRQLTVALPARAKLGSNTAAISFRWPDGLVQSRDVFWAVEPRIRLTPPALVLKARDGAAEVTVEARSTDRPFGITRVSGAILASDGPTSPQPAPTHTLRLMLDPAKATPGVKPEVEIATDDPDQPLLKLGVLVMPRSEATP